MLEYAAHAAETWTVDRQDGCVIRPRSFGEATPHQPPLPALPPHSPMWHYPDRHHRVAHAQS